MKKSVKSILVMLVVIMSIATTSANNLDETIKVSKVQSKSMNLTSYNSNQELHMEVKDVNGIVLYAEDLKASESFSKNYNFKNLVNGEYFVTIKSTTKVRKVPFKIADDELIIDTINETSSHNPTLRVKEDTVFVSMLALNETDSLNVTLYDNDSNVLYTEVLEGDVNLGRIFNIENLEKGKYTAILRSNGETFTETFIKK